MNLVLVHGRDQQGKDPDKLKRSWIAALEEGLGKKLDNKVNVIFPFYGDDLDKLIKKRGAEEPSLAIAKGELADDKLEFYEEFLSEIKKMNNISDEQVREVPTDPIIQKGALNWPWVIRLMRVLDKTKVGERSIEQFTFDVFMYLTELPIRNAVDKIVREAIGTEPCVVVGHSLGTVVCYNVLNNLQSNNVKQFFTVGSPLAVTTIKKNIMPPPLRMPGSVLSKKWFNAYDPQDFVALNPLDQVHFGITPSIVNDGTVKNKTSNHHGIEHYLNHKPLAQLIGEALAD